jgi:hypothetical protein
LEKKYENDIESMKAKIFALERDLAKAGEDQE